MNLSIELCRQGQRFIVCLDGGGVEESRVEGGRVS